MGPRVGLCPVATRGSGVRAAGGRRVAQCLPPLGGQGLHSALDAFRGGGSTFVCKSAGDDALRKSAERAILKAGVAQARHPASTVRHCAKMTGLHATSD